MTVVSRVADAESSSEKIENLITGLKNAEAIDFLSNQS